MRNYFKSAALILMAFMILGCSTSGSKAWLTEDWKKHGQNGNCSEALNDIEKNGASIDPGQKAALIGVTYLECKKDRATAIKYLTLSARYGNAWSQEHLIALGASVPSADLAKSNYSGSSSSAESNAGLGLYLFDAAIKGWNAGAQRSSNEVDCTSIAYGKDYVRTNCR